jgi:hypothetical protein
MTARNSRSAVALGSLCPVMLELRLLYHKRLGLIALISYVVMRADKHRVIGMCKKLANRGSFGRGHFLAGVSGVEADDNEGLAFVE